MNVTLPDADSKLRLIAELARTSLELRDDFIRKNRDKIAPVFDGYVAASDRIQNPSYHAVLLGFREAWRKGDFQTILAVGEKLPDEFITHYPEIRAFLGGALNQTGRG